LRGDQKQAPAGRVTISDVAARAGVAVGTASKALNGRGTLRGETRERVLSAARELNFEPNRIAKGLITGRTYTVGLITTDNFGRFSIPIMRGAEDALGTDEIAVLLCDGRNDPIREQHFVRTLLARRVDGILVTGRRTEPRAPIAAPCPVVYAITQSRSADDCSVVADEAGGVRLAVDHLLATGRTRIAHITGPAHHRSARIRADTFLSHLAARGAEPVGVEPLFGTWSETWGREALRMLLSRDSSVDAIFCGSDQIARGVADAALYAGIPVPDEIALVGFDNWDLMVEAAQPPLSSIDMNLEEIGRVAATHLLSAIQGQPAHGVEVVAGRLVARQSSAGRPRPALASR
jgi:LacI family transcriptional regulator